MRKYQGQKYVADINACVCHDNVNETSNLKKSSDSVKAANCMYFTKMPKENEIIQEGQRKKGKNKIIT